MTDVRLLTRNLLSELQRLGETADTIYIVTAFLMRSGVRELLPMLQRAIVRGADMKIVTGDYLAITQPDALTLLFESLPEAEIRMIESGGVSFHPKAYLFGSSAGDSVIVGSSNVSKSALTTGIEWNLHAPSSASPLLFESAAAKFMELFLSPLAHVVNLEQIAHYREQYDRMNARLPFSREWEEAEELALTLGAAEKPDVVFERADDYGPVILEPRPAQALALQALNDSLAEGRTSALAVLATGLGKTYLAAFFAKSFGRILFIAHREELLLQAKASFERVHPKRSCGIVNGFTKETTADIVFASIQTLSMDRHLRQFDSDTFDLVIVDECHHVMAASYERVLAHFTPRFLLGLTATPERLDNKDVYSLCDGNVALSVNFFEAIRNGWLSPFVYYGVFDETDYSGLSFRNNRYDEEELLQLQIQTDYAAAVCAAWCKHKQTRTLAFCSSVRQVQFLSSYFAQKGVRSVALHGSSERTVRTTARERLETGQLDIIFTVDLFNEGVDIPRTDTLLFVRPTESTAVFTQQIGRGLRLANGKSQCVIIDLIGNYRTARSKFTVFTDQDLSGTATITSETLSLPGQWEFNFETAVIDLLEALKPKMNRKAELVAAFQDLKRTLGRRPTYLEYHLKADANARDIKQLFKSYPLFLQKADTLSELEEEVLTSYREWFVNVSTTSMTKSYKMVLLHVMLARGEQDWYKPISPKEAAAEFHRYLTAAPYRQKDWSSKKGKALLTYDETTVAKLIADMPMNKWSGSANGIVLFEDGLFSIQINPPAEHLAILFDWTQQICNGALHMYFERRSNEDFSIYQSTYTP
ncbi:DEAD/DEAH box helicase family protein [Sporosarcina koreensis]|uniref:DEAD/DEAH box helicase family protein n=1 Tax=Sporosarcina koreensis TaxID=334735 RepID=UPI0006949C7C|nr:DEAD/DEAH box helicase family protein [Sporosarcina koreensis]